jgi:uncharacterized protein with von Willebrand factor type A (vWA) domain
MNDLREETRNESINRIMNNIISATTPIENQRANLSYEVQKITDREAVDWLLLPTNQGKIIQPHLFNFFIGMLTDETKRSASRMVAMNKLKQQLLELQRQQQQQQQQQPPVVGGGGSRHRANKHSKKQSKKSRKTKSRRH